MSYVISSEIDIDPMIHGVEVFDYHPDNAKLNCPLGGVSGI